MKNFNLKKYLAEGKLLEEKKGGFAFWYRSGARGEKNALQARELLTQKGIDADYSKGPYYIDFSKSDAEESVVTQLLQDANLTNYVILRDDEGLDEANITEAYADTGLLKKLGVDGDVMEMVKKMRAAIESGKVKEGDLGTIEGIGDAIKKMVIDGAESFLK